MNSKKIARAYAKSVGYDGVEYLGTYQDKEVFNPTYDRDDTAFVGAPLVIFVENGEARMSTADEAFEYLDYTLQNSPAEADEDEEN